MTVTSRFRFLAALLMVLPLTLASNDAAARCDIIDVIELVKDGESRTNIRRECESIVDDAPGCSLTKVMRYAKDRFSERQISRRCKTASNTRRSIQLPAPPALKVAPQIARFCTTPLGACPMMTPIPSGSRCHCVMPYGPVFGIAR
jgi:hypothetical protein